MSKANTVNLGWQFYRNYFRDFFVKQEYVQNPEAFFAKKEAQIFGFKQDNYAAITAYTQLKEQMGFWGFSLETAYPGLLIGTGYNHEIAAKGATKIGFYFDHTTGLPTIPGSSIKGVLRSIFPGQDLDRKTKLATEIGKIRHKLDAAKTEEEKSKLNLRLVELDDKLVTSEEIAAGKEAYLNDILKTNGYIEQALSREEMLELELELFTGQLKDERFTAGNPSEKGEGHIAMPQRFICHDAVVTGVKQQLMGSDFITPHKSILAEPVPLQMVKVMPEVTFQFTFQSVATYRLLNDRGEVFTRAAKLTERQLQVFLQSILLDIGVGAKTNLGYGQFMGAGGELPPPSKVQPGHENTNQLTSAAPPKSTPKAFSIEDHEPLPGKRLKVGRKVLAQVIAVDGNEILVQLHAEDWDTPLSMKYFRKDKPTLGSWGEVSIKDVTGRFPKIRAILLDNNKFDLR